MKALCLSQEDLLVYKSINTIKSNLIINVPTYSGPDRRRIYLDPGGADTCIGYRGTWASLEDLPERRQEW